jgi:hypothetical protein
VAYLVVGANDLRDRPAALMDGENPTPWLRLESRRGSVAVWQVLPR